MRLPIGLAAIALLGLLGGSLSASTAIAPQAANAAEPVPAEPATEMQAVMNTSPEAERFGSEISACMSDAAHLPAGADAGVFCSCAVDKMINHNMSRPEAAAQCTAEARVTGTDLRAGEIRECVSGAPGHLPAGTDSVAFCSCAVDKMLTHNTPQRQAIDQCATEMHITLPSQD
jgi:hypothetical protein